jgi:hypothetical protein
MKQPEALRLAEITEFDKYPRHPDHNQHTATELRRLHEVEQGFDKLAERYVLKNKELVQLRELNTELLNVLSWIADQTYDPWTNGAEAGRVAKFAVEKATKE